MARIFIHIPRLLREEISAKLDMPSNDHKHIL